MKLNRLIIHEIIKESGKINVEYIPSQHLLKTDEGLTNMMLNIHESFDKSISSYHKFKAHSQEKAIYKNARKYLKTENTDKQFLSLSRTGMRELAESLKDVPFATGGYYIFSDYEFKGYQYLSITIVRDKDAFNIKWDSNTNTYNVDTTQNINIEQMAMGFRLNMGLYKLKDQRNYIALVNKKAEDTSQYFKDWVCVDEGTSGKLNTNNLIRIIKDLGQPENFDGDEDDFLKYVYDNIQAEQKANKGHVNVDRISELFYHDSRYLRNYAEEEYGEELDAEFKVHLASLRKLIRYRAHVKGIAVSLDVEHFQNQTVELRDNSVIIKSRSIYEQLKRQRDDEDL